MTTYCSLIIVGLCMLIGCTGGSRSASARFFAIGGYVAAFLTTFDLKLAPGCFVSLLRNPALVAAPSAYGQAS